MHNFFPKEPSEENWIWKVQSSLGETGKIEDSSRNFKRGSTISG
jgi:hypothetical protein